MNPTRQGPSRIATRIDYLDGWRGLAISLVLCAHFLPESRLVDSGQLGVNVFFSLSGFLMSNILFVKRTPIPTFYRHRISRICPVFFLFVASIYFAGWCFGRSNSWVEIISTATFLRTYFPVPPTIWRSDLPIGHLWLNAEEHCYVILSVVAFFAFLSTRAG